MTAIRDAIELEERGGELLDGSSLQLAAAGRS